MQRQRIDEIGADLRLRQILAQRIAPRVADGELVKDGFAPLGDRRDEKIGQFEFLAVARRDRPPPLGPAGQVAEFHVQRRRL